MESKTTIRADTDPAVWHHTGPQPDPLNCPAGRGDPDWSRSHSCLTPSASDEEVSDAQPFPDSLTLQIMSV